MINLLIIKNPFEKQTERKQAPYIPGQTVFDYIYPHFMLPESEIEVFYGGKQLTELEMRSIIVRPGDYIIAGQKIMGGGDGDGKNIVTTIAAIVIMMYAGWAGNAATALSTGTTSAAVVQAGGMAAWNFWGYAAAIGTQVAGGYLLNYYAKKNQPEAEQASPTYGWDSVRSLTGQGQPVPVVFGTVRAAGQIIAQHVTSNGTKQYLNLLVQCAEGPCDYTGNGKDADCVGIDNIKINNNPLSNYTGITVHKRAGLNNQSVIPNFENTRVEQQIGVELKYDSVWHTFTTTNDTGSGLELTFTMPALYDQEYKGTRRWENTIRLEIQYKLHTKNQWTTFSETERRTISQINGNKFRLGPWSDFCYVGQQIEIISGGIAYSASVIGIRFGDDSNSDEPVDPYTEITVNIAIPAGAKEVQRRNYSNTITGKYLTTFNRVIKINTGVIGQYDVRCRCIYKYAYGDDDAHTIYWSKLAHIFYDDFIYPNKALLSIQALANDQISGSANVTFELARSKVWVWVPDDPDLDPWGPGSYQEMPSNNPAWACYWLNHRVYRMYNINTGEYEFIVRGAEANRMKYTDFKAWADFCTERGIEVNVYFDTIQRIREAMQIFEDLGRGRVIPEGTRIGCMFDGPAEKDANGDIVYSQVFNVANIGLDSFSEQWVDVSERATAIEVTFNNSDNNHEKEVMLVPADGLTEGTATGNVTQLTIAASVPRSVAWKHCKYKLRLNNYINNTVNITTSVNAIVSKLGQVIGVQHDVPQWGFGGRVESATTTQITLDKPVTMEADKTYSALFWLNNDEKIEKNVVLEPGETSVLTISEPFENDTLEAEYVNSTMFWVDGDQTALFNEGQLLDLFHSTGDQTEYVISAVYDTELLKTVVEVTNCPEDLQQVRFAWTMPHENDQWLFGPVEDGVKKHSRPFKIMGFTRENDLTYRITAVNYEDAVCTESETVPDIDYGLIEPIFEVESLAVEEETFLQVDGTLVSQLNVSWTLPIGKTADRVLVYYSEDGGLTWFLGADTIDTKAIITNVKTGVSYLIKAVVVKELIFSTGVTASAIMIQGKDTPPSDVPSLLISQNSGKLKATITFVDDPDVDEYEIRYGVSWDNSTQIITMSKFDGNTSKEFDAPRAGTLTFFVKAHDRSDHYSLNATSYTLEVFTIPNKNLIYDSSIDLDECVLEQMYLSPWHELKIESIETLDSYDDFFAMFEDSNIHLKTSPSATLPVADLGPNVLQPDCYYVDPWGVLHLLSEETLDSYETFFDMFEDPTITRVPAQPTIKTYLGLDIDFNSNVNTKVDSEYHTRSDGDEWTAWHSTKETLFTGRRIETRLLPVSIDRTTNVDISAIQFKVDVPDVTDRQINISVPVEGVYVKHQQRYFDTPVIENLVTRDLTGMTANNQITNETKEGCNVFLFDLSGNPAAGTIKVIETRGY